jgi:hypothetical protein
MGFTILAPEVEKLSMTATNYAVLTANFQTAKGLDTSVGHKTSPAAIERSKPPTTQAEV